MLESSPDIESSPELSESFEMYLQQRKQKVKDEKLKLAAASRGYHESPRTTKAEPPRQTCNVDDTLDGPDDTLMECTEDSFLAMEKMCENTIHLNNVSENLIDLTALDASMKALRKSLKKLPSFDETHLDSVEAPSFMFNNTTLASPLKHSPLITSNANRPSTIMEVSEISSANRTNMTSYQTAYTRNGTAATSSSYKTASEGSFEGERSSTEESRAFEKSIPMPKVRSFYSEVEDLTRDSLEPTINDNNRSSNMTTDSLNADDSETTSGVDSSYDQRNDSDFAGGDNLNDTLEQIEFMLAQAQKMQEQKTPRFVPNSPVTPCTAKLSFKPKVNTATTHSPLMKKLTAPKHSPLIKFSPVVKRNPADPAFKRPMNSATKIPQTSASTSKKFQHVESPISRYIKDTPGMPLSSTVRSYHGIGKGAKHFNFRDSESFCKENESMNAMASGGSSLPCLAKTKSSAKARVRISEFVSWTLVSNHFSLKVFDQRDSKKTPGGQKVHNLLTFASPTVTKHQGHVHTQAQDRSKPSQNCLSDETALSEQSFADLSLISGDVSVQFVEAAKRLKN